MVATAKDTRCRDCSTLFEGQRCVYFKYRVFRKLYVFYRSFRPKATIAFRTLLSFFDNNNCLALLCFFLRETTCCWRLLRTFLGIKDDKSFVLYAGYESNDFLALFPTWSISEDAKTSNSEVFTLHDFVIALVFSMPIVWSQSQSFTRVSTSANILSRSFRHVRCRKTSTQSVWKSIWPRTNSAVLLEWRNANLRICLIGRRSLCVKSNSSFNIGRLCDTVQTQ